MVDAVVDAPASQLAPIDDTVKIPESVRRAAELAESFYKPQQPVVEPASAEPGEPQNPDNQAQVEPVEPAIEPVVEPPPVQPEPPQATPPQQGQMTPEQQAEHRYLSMKGRFDQQVQINAGMQAQMQEMSNELMRMQAVLQQATEKPTPQQVQRFVTEEDEQAYGPEIIDMMRRAALEGVSPQLNSLSAENQQLRTAMQQQALEQHQRKLADLQVALAQAVPNYDAINNDPRFREWLSLPNVYSRNIRSQELMAAYEAADAPTVIAFFKGFLAEEAATGHSAQGQQAQAASAPRTPAVALNTLAAPGKARPASGDTQTPVEKPVFTHAQIRRFYDDVRKGVYAGREADKQRDEAAIFAAQREGRIR